MGNDASGKSIWFQNGIEELAEEKNCYWWAWVELNHRPCPYHRGVKWFYNNLQGSGDCQTSHRSHKDTQIVGWVVG